MTAIERLLAYEEIRQLAARYALAVDGRDLDTLVGLFVDDVDAGSYGTGSAALRRSFEDSLGAVGITILHVGTQVIDLVDADHATGSVYCRGEVQDGSRWLHQSILYRDAYERRHDRWLFVRRRHELFYGAEVGVNPLGLPPADWPRRHDGMGTVPGGWATWRAFWRRTDREGRRTARPPDSRPPVGRPPVGRPPDSGPPDSRPSVGGAG